MIFIESKEEIKKLYDCMNQKDSSFLINFFYKNELHPIDNEVMLVIISELSNSKNSYVISLGHPDVVQIPNTALKILLETESTKYIFNKKNILHNFYVKNSIDIDAHYYYQTKKQIAYKSTFSNGYSIPIMNIIKSFKDTLNFYKFNIEIEFNPKLNEFIDSFSKSLNFIEKNKIYSNEEHKLLNTQYNIFTPTARPSNAFNNTNFSALNKKKGERNKFTSRYGKDGGIVMIDYESYHLRLFANHIKFELPSKSIHQYLGELYHDKTNLTNEEYDLSKKITFNLMYGGISKDIYDNIPFMKEIADYVDVTYKKYKSKKYIETWYFNRKINQCFFKENDNPYKIFNYLLQSAETERNCLILEKLISYIKNTKINLVLYTYDAFLFDCHREEISKFKEILPMLEENKKFPTKIYAGHNYGNLNEISV
jgi:hypothetical protein